MHHSLPPTLQMLCSLFNKQSNSHWEATNTYTANVVHWIQNPIDKFRIYVEKFKYLSYSFKSVKDYRLGSTLVGTVVPSRHFVYLCKTTNDAEKSNQVKPLLLLRPELPTMVYAWINIDTVDHFIHAIFVSLNQVLC